MLIKYGTRDMMIDVTSICNTVLKKDNYIMIPSSDQDRSRHFSDPLPGTLKSVFIIDEDNTITEYNSDISIYIDVSLNKIVTENIPYSIKSVDDKLKFIHSNLKMVHGSLLEEVPEQKMAVRYLTGDERVLEIGGNVGRNSLVISYILGQKDNNNLVVLECDTDIYNQLNENKELNSMQFHVENSALSKRNLIQIGWDTIVSDTLLPGYKSVTSITYEQLVSKYSIEFDTLVLDCEGAFYYIIQDMPEVLDNIKLIIMENDYNIINHKLYIDSVLNSKNFKVDYSQGGGWGPCANNFFEVWVKSS